MFSVKGNDNHVIKIFWAPEHVKPEVDALKKLKGCCYVVQLEEVSGVAVVLSPRATSTAAFATLRGTFLPSQLADIVLALKACHTVGVLHRDVRPCNILVIGEGHSAKPVLADFGASSFQSEQPASYVGAHPFYQSGSVLAAYFSQPLVHYQPKDDLHSLVRCVYVAALQPLVDPITCDEKWVESFWADNLVSEPWASMVECADSVDYAGLFKLIADYMVSFLYS